eukprot:Platyproteum_vivax@DN7861_c0_g1_i1.p1
MAISEHDWRQSAVHTYPHALCPLAVSITASGSMREIADALADALVALAAGIRRVKRRRYSAAGHEAWHRDDGPQAGSGIDPHLSLIRKDTPIPSLGRCNGPKGS